MSFRERLQSWRYNLVPDHLVGEILTKRWTDNAIPFLALVVTLATFGSVIPGFFKLTSLQESTRQLGEFSMVVTGMTRGDARAVASTCRSVRSSRWPAFPPSMSSSSSNNRSGWRWPRRSPPASSSAPSTAISSATCACAPSSPRWSPSSSAARCSTSSSPPTPPTSQLSTATSDVLDFIGDGTVLRAVPSRFAGDRPGHRHPHCADALAAWLACAGGGRLAPLGPQRRHPRAAHGVHDLCRLRHLRVIAGFLIACRLSGAGPGTGLNLEIMALTAAVVGGNSLGGGRGSVVKGADGRHHRAGDDQRPDPPRLRHRHQPDGAGHHAGRRRHASTSAG